MKSVCALALVAFCATGASAQGFLKKLKKAAETVTSITGTGEQAADTTAASAADSISPKELAATMPMYRVVEVVKTDENGDTLRNEDQTVESVCSAGINRQRKHIHLRFFQQFCRKKRRGFCEVAKFSAKDFLACKRELLRLNKIYYIFFF